MQDLAKELKTTSATVSRALNNSPQISEAMTKRVKALAKKHNFKPNNFASNLRKGKSKTIGIVVPFINRHFFSNIIHHIEVNVSKHGYNVMICQTEESFNKEQEYLETLINQRVSGIIIALTKNTTTYTHLQKAISEGIKVIQIDNVLKDINTSYIKSKDREGAKATVLHLLKQGYQNIALLNGNMTSHIYQDRKLGYLDAHQEMGITPNKKLFYENTNNRAEGIEATKQLIDSKEPFDAIFSSGDYAALGAYLVLKEKGIKIPQEVGISGFANEDFAELVNPSITSSDQNSSKIGQDAATQILEEIDNVNAELLKISILPKLIVRESSKKH